LLLHSLQVLADLAQVKVFEFLLVNQTFAMIAAVAVAMADEIVGEETKFEEGDLVEVGLGSKLEVLDLVLER
jgi:hypothetical protein